MSPAPRRARAASPVGPRSFPQARARATYQALLDGARRVFSERGFDAAQTPEIAARAGVSVGTFYRYFDDKREALLELMRIHLAEASERVLGELSPERLEGDHRAAIDAALEVLFAEARRAPALERLYQEMALRDEEVARMREAFEAASERALAALIARFTTRKAIPDPLAAAHVIQQAALVTALGEAAGSATGGGQRRVGERAVKHALREMIQRYLFGEAGSSITKVPGASSSRKSRPPRARAARREN